MKPSTRFQDHPIFKHVSAFRLGRLAGVWLEERYERGAVIFRQGTPAECIWIVLEGWVHLVRSPNSDENRGVVLFTITPREALCGISALDSGTYNMGGVAATDCRLLRIPSEAFIEALTHEPAFAYDVLRLCARRIQKIAEQYGAMAESVSHRVVRAILRLQDQFGETIPMTHRELAQMSWTTTESAIRIVRKLKQRGWVEGMRGRLTVRRPKALASLLQATNSHGTI